MSSKKIEHADITWNLDQPSCLFEKDGHAIYWLGASEANAFRTNTFLIRDGDETLIIDPGSREFFRQTRDRVAQIVSPSRVTGMILHHQDPDVSASMVDWLEINPRMNVYTSPRTQVLLPSYGCRDYKYVDNEEAPRLALPTGAELKFIPSPFLHFPGAFTTYDAAIGCLFSSDVFASLNTGMNLWTKGFSSLEDDMRMFHVEYMASNIAARGFTRRLDGLEINAILPQHGCLIGADHTGKAIDWLANLRCGTDLIYPDLDPYP